MLLWQENSFLKYEDFLAKPNHNIQKNEKFLGAISSISINWFYAQKKPYSAPKITIQTYFDKTQSWILLKNPYVLQHEQIHFNITELFARKMRKSAESLNQLRILSPEIYKLKMKEWSKLKNNYNQQFDQENDDYCYQIGNQILIRKNPKQQEWKEKIERELNELRNYK